ncbi:MAG: hypothetical protein M3406_13265 [Chloroflexota bacterium]|nr:hypothetical protein [Chloroflexota bacterium]
MTNGTDVARDRRTMANQLEERMVGTYASLRAEQGLRYESSLVKTYLVEARATDDTGPEAVRRFAAEIFGSPALGERITSRPMLDTEDETLLPVLAEVVINRRREDVLAYVDLSDPRFWLVHSMASSNATDFFIDRAVAAGPELDRAWLPANLLEAATRLGSFRGLNLSYDRREIPDIDFTEPNTVEFLKMQLWGPVAATILEILRDQDVLRNQTTLSKVKVKYWLERGNEDVFSLDDIRYDGKVTARGTSFQSHIGIVSEVYRKYSAVVRNIERTYALVHSSEDTRLKVHGEPITFLIDPPIDDLGVFVNSVFSAGDPFRLWGVPVVLADDYVRVEAVDLHVGGTVRFEIAPEIIRMYLPSGSCGNSALRMYTNLQHHYRSLVTAVDSNGASVFEF